MSLYPAGFLHDLKYWAGYPGEDVARLLNSTTMAETMFHGVRLGGADQLNASFSWGFGRKTLDVHREEIKTSGRSREV